METMNARNTAKPKASPPASVTYESHAMAYVVRFCGAHPSSIAAAVGQAIVVLDNFLRGLGVPSPAQLFVVYRNHIAGAVTVQVGYPVSEDTTAAVTGEVFAGNSPSGPMVELFGEKSLDQILAVGRSLPESSSSYTWQIFEAADFRPWTGKLVESLMVPAGYWPQIQDHSASATGGI